MRFERTEDPVLVRQIVTHEAIYPYVTDDNAPSAQDCHPPMHKDLLYLLCRDEDALLGMWLFVPSNSVTWEVHTYLLPDHGWRKGRQAARECAAFIWANTGCQRLWTVVPEFNRAALMFAKSAGFKPFGINERSFLKGGKLYNQTCLGLSRP